MSSRRGGRALVGILSAIVLVAALLGSQRIGDSLGAHAVNALGPAHAIGPTDPSTPLTFWASLRLRSAKLHAFLNRMHDPASPAYHGYLDPPAFGERFGLPATAIDEAAAWLRGRGFQVDAADDPQRTSIEVRGPIGLVGRVFDVSFQDFVDPTGERFFATTATPSIPHALAGTVTGLSGLDDRPPPPASVGTHALNAVPGQLLGPRDVAKAWNIQPLWDAGYQGQGQTVAVISFASFDPNDVAMFEREAGIVGAQPIGRVPVAGGSNDTTSETSGEVNLDLDTVLTVAPKAKILNFEGGNSATFGGMVKAIVADGRAKIATISYGYCDLPGSAFVGLTPPDERAADAQEFAAAEAMGVSVFVSSGDMGAYTCQRNDPTNELGVGLELSGSWPSDSPSVISVGGTRLTRASDRSYVQEQGWQDALAGLGGGGGLNPDDPIPSWQVGTGVDNEFSNGNRQVPDVAGPADWADWDSDFFTVFGKEASPGNGTSQASPFWAGSLALVQQYASDHGAGRLGFVNPMLYQLAGTQGPPPFHDVTVGGNRYYPCTRGWDFATGLGSPDVANLARAATEYAKAHPTG